MGNDSATSIFSYGELICPILSKGGTPCCSPGLRAGAGKEARTKAGSEGELGVRVQVAGSCKHMPGFVPRTPRLINSSTRREPQGQPRGKNKLKKINAISFDGHCFGQSTNSKARRVMVAGERVWGAHSFFQSCYPWSFL